jgi:hypothetical protein
MATIIGFTGTRDGMTSAQAMRVVHLVDELAATDFHHGCCVGADAEAHQGIMFANLNVRFHVHPSTLTGLRAKVFLREGLDVVHTPKAPLDRNRDIVDAAAVLIAAPKEMTETLRSGTWATVRYARKQRKQVWIVWPDGTVSEPHPAPRRRNMED